MVAAVTAVAGALVLLVRRRALMSEAEEHQSRHSTEDGVAVFAN